MAKEGVLEPATSVLLVSLLLMVTTRTRPAGAHRRCMINTKLL